MALLGGLRVLDLTMWRPGPYATQLLAQLGAEVLKVEPPGGEPMRAFRGHFELLNRHKRSIVIDLRTDAARCLALAGGADVFVEGYRPGVADRLGVGYDAVHAVNPGIVYCSISGYGASGPLADLPGHDVNYRAYAGAAPPDDGGHDLPVADMAALPRDEVVARLRAAGAPVAPVLTRVEMLSAGHFRERGVVDRGPFHTTVHPRLPPRSAPELGCAEGWDRAAPPEGH